MGVDKLQKDGELYKVSTHTYTVYILHKYCAVIYGWSIGNRHIWGRMLLLKIRQSVHYLYLLISLFPLAIPVRQRMTHPLMLCK